MTFRHLFKYGRTLSLQALVSKSLSYGAKRFKGWAAQRRYGRLCTYAALNDHPGAPIPGRFAEIPIPAAGAPTQALAAFAGHFVDQEFDLLGSGWIRVVHGKECPGFEGSNWASHRRPANLLTGLSPGNRERAASIRAEIDAAFTPIDWQLDFRSGYRWDEGKRSELAELGHLPGVDIKVPWELGRCQHLPVLALAWRSATHGMPGFLAPDIYRAAYRNQVLDFLAANPPGYGVNWACPMDVAIRAANLALARWLFGDAAELDPAFDQELASGLVAHGRHIAANLEWSPDDRGNHYLANLAGLAFSAAALAASPETNAWLNFAIRELTVEVERQFTDDGANFEGSTCYHRLSAEITVYTAALVLGLGDQRRDTINDFGAIYWPKDRPPPNQPLIWHPTRGPFPAWFGQRLERMAAFTMAVTKPNGQVVQIGDNDSGRLFKAGLGQMRADGSENHLDHRGLVAAVGGLIDRPDMAEFAGSGYVVERALIEALGGANRWPSAAVSPLASLPSGSAVGADQTASAGPQSEVQIPITDMGVMVDLKATAFPDFGLYIWRGSRIFLSVRCGAAAHDGRGGHAHNDQLAIELNIDGEDWLADPGSYVYTAAPALRDAYRSVKAHAAPRLQGAEPGRLDLGMFRLGLDGPGRCLIFTADSFDGLHEGYGPAVYRSIRLHKDRILVRDRFGGPVDWDTEAEVSEIAGSAEELRRLMDVNLAFSEGYGLASSASAEPA